MFIQNSTGLRRHLSYSNVIATIALFLAIGGGGFALAALKKNSVKSKQIAPNAVKTSDIADGSVTTPILADNAATGTKVDEASLGQVPSAALADNATNAVNAANADNAVNAGTVDGANAADLRTSSAFDENSTGGIALGGSPVPVASATITTHGSGRILATGSAELEGATADEEGACQILIDGDNSTFYHSAADDIGNSNTFVIAVNFAVTRPAGTYTASLRCFAQAGTVEKEDAAINVYGLGG